MASPEQRVVGRPMVQVQVAAPDRRGWCKVEVLTLSAVSADGQNIEYERTVTKVRMTPKVLRVPKS